MPNSVPDCALLLGRARVRIRALVRDDSICINACIVRAPFGLNETLALLLHLCWLVTPCIATSETMLRRFAMHCVASPPSQRHLAADSLFPPPHHRNTFKRGSTAVRAEGGQDSGLPIEPAAAPAPGVDLVPQAHLDGTLVAVQVPRNLGSQSVDASSTGAFQRLPMVAPSKELLESAVKRAGRVPVNKKLKNEAQKAKNRRGARDVLRCPCLLAALR